MKIATRRQIARGNRRSIAVSTPSAAFGTAVALAQVKTQYFASIFATRRTVSDMDATGLTGQCAIMCQYGHPTETAFVHLIPDDGAAAVWSKFSPIANTYSAGLATNADEVFWAANAGALGVFQVQSASVSDGTENWTVTPPSGPCYSWRGVSYAPTAQRITTIVGNNNNEILHLDSTDGSNLGDTDDVNLIIANSTGFYADESAFLIGGYDRSIEVYAMPFVNGAAPTATLDYSASYSRWWYQDGNSAIACPKITSDRVAGGAWLAGGTSGVTDDYPYLHHIESSGHTEDKLINVGADSGYAPGTYNKVVSCCVDKYGDVYALLINALTGGEADIVRYTSDGTLVYSARTNGVADLPDATARSIAVDEAGTIYIGDTDGYVHVFTQAA